MYELKFRYLILFILGVFINGFQHGVAYAQMRTFAGKIIDDETNKAIEGATLTLSSTKVSIMSKTDGTFAVSAQQFPTLRITHVNYLDTIVTLRSMFQTISLKPKYNNLEEIVIRRNNINDVDMRNLVGNVITIDMTKLSERSELDIGRLLEGQVPGLTVNFSGELGTKPQIRIRGNASFAYQQSANEPLFVLDGIIISTETFMTLNVHDFQTIKVLKDAPATALYGIKAANGVIELTSKKGFIGKPEVSVSMNHGVTLRGQRTAEMMNTREKLQFEERIEAPGTPGYMNSERYIRRFFNSSDVENELLKGANRLDSLSQYNVDWFKELIKLNHFQTYNLGVRGGTDKSNYFYSANYSKQGGRVMGNDVNNISVRANLDYSLSRKLQLSINNSFGISTSNTENGMQNDPTSLAFTLNPYETQQSQNLTSYPGISYADLMNQFKAKTTAKRFGSTLIGHWDMLPGLNISSVFGIDYNMIKSYKRIYGTAYTMRNNPKNAKGFISDGNTEDVNFTSNIRANYQRKFGNHDIYAGINTDYYTLNTHTITGSGYGISDDIESLIGINQTLVGSFSHVINGSKVSVKQLGFGAAMGYSYDGIYDFYASLKRDGSSLLPSNKRWNDAWSAGIGWSPSMYNFFKRQQIVTSLKVKGSIGYTASMVGISMRDINTTYNNSNYFYGSHRLLQLLALPNKNLNPQQTDTRNIAIDFGFFSRVNLLVNWYDNLTKQAIISVPIAPSNGFINYNQNIGELQNKGVEFSFSGDVIRGKDWRLNSSLSWSYNKNTVRKLYGTNRLYLKAESVIPEYEVGKPLGLVHGLQTNGIHPITGLPEFIDRSGHIIDFTQANRPEYFVNLGHSIAPYSGFFNNHIAYKNWSFTVYINFSFGGIAKFSDTYVRGQQNARFNAIKGQLGNMWFERGDENKLYPSRTMPGSIYDLYSNYASTRTIYKTDFIKLNHVQLSYNLISSPSTRKYLKSMRLSLQADNLYTYNVEVDRGSLNNVTQPIITFSIHTSF